MSHQRPELAPNAASQWLQIVDSARDTAIIATDPHGTITSWNTGAQLMFLWSEAEVLGHALNLLFTEQDRKNGQLAREMEEAISLGRGGHEGWRVRKDGTRLWAVGELTPIRNESGIIGFVKIVRDTTAQREAENDAREERRALEVLNRAGSTLSLERDLHRLVQIVTDAGVELTRAEFGAFFYNVIDRSGERYLLYTLSGAPLEAFSQFPMPRNTKVFAQTFEGAGIVRSDDITEDPQYGQNAPHSGMPEGHLPVRSYLAVPVISRSGEVIGGLFFGHAQRAIFTKRSEEGLVGLAAQAAVAIDNARLAEATAREIAERKQAQEALDELNQSLERQVAERAEELRKQEAALRQAQKMEAIGQLTGGVAHDFNNLLQIIMGNLEMLQRRLPDNSSQQLRRVAAQAMNGAKRAAILTQRLLAFSRRQPLDPKPTDPNALVAGMSDMLHRTLGEAVSVETVSSAGIWKIEVDQGEMEAALLNLAVNARDAMPEGGQLTIETANSFIDETYARQHAEVQPGQYVMISVSDTGIGMDETTAAQAFDPFFTTKSVGKGTGLGLSQVYGFVKQSGGHVKIYSEVGQGTTVKIYVPRWIGEHEAIEPTAEAFIPEGQQRETILVIEDDEDVRSYSVDSLRELGYTVLDARDGPGGLKLLRLHPHIDLIFTDVVLPNGMTGAQIQREAQQSYPHIRVLFTTGYARNAIIHHGRLDKGVSLITKPFTFAELAAKVRDILDSSES
jgi:PAS domain S-box-containing protein